MKTALSFAVAALIYGASATQVNQMTSLATQAATTDDGMGWCDMNQQQRDAWVKAQEAPLTAATRKYKADVKEARTTYKNIQKNAYAKYKRQVKSKTAAALKKAGKTKVRQLSKRQKAQLKQVLKGAVRTYKKAMEPARATFNTSLKALKAKFNRDKKTLTNQMNAKIKAFSKTAAECAAMESSSEEEPDTPVVTKPKKVTQECTGAIDRLTNEQTANLFELAKQKSGPYQDVSFPADTTSMCWEKATPKGDCQKYNDKNKFVWKRASEINKNSPGSLWGSKGIHPGAVQQGGLGNCWWVAVASSLAEWPERVEKIFKNYDQDKGIYELEMWRAGQPTKVVIDDRLLVHKGNHGDHPQYARQGKTGAWWVSLLEKAAAKYYGRYDRMAGGNGWEAFNQLTGYPTKTYRFYNWSEQKILDLVKTADDKHNVMWGGGNDGGAVGFYAGHLYSVLGHTRWNGMDFVQWRNPWGNGEYTGPWSDKDKKTDPAKLAAFRAHVKQYEGHENKENDGKFWMELSDVRKYISDITVGFYLDDFHLTQFNKDINLAQNYHTFTLNNPVTQHVWIHSDSIHGRQFMDGSESCSKIKKGHMYYHVEIEVNNKKERITDAWWAGYKEFKALPAGQYKIRATSKADGKKINLKTYNVNVNAWANKKAVTIA